MIVHIKNDLMTLGVILTFRAEHKDKVSISFSLDETSDYSLTATHDRVAFICHYFQAEGVSEEVDVVKIYSAFRSVEESYAPFKNGASKKTMPIDQLPGINCTADNPVTGLKQPIKSIVIDLNDRKGWSRDQIADWLDSLHDSGKVDLSFKTEENIA